MASCCATKAVLLVQVAHEGLLQENRDSLAGGVLLKQISYSESQHFLMIETFPP